MVRHVLTSRTLLESLAEHGSPAHPVVAVVRAAAINYPPAGSHARMHGAALTLGVVVNDRF